MSITKTNRQMMFCYQVGRWKYLENRSKNIRKYTVCQNAEFLDLIRGGT
jgi:hypothetical protein